jgi:lysophospholipase L1-like esterase
LKTGAEQLFERRFDAFRFALSPILPPMKKLILNSLFAVLFFASIAAGQTYERANLWQKEIDAFAEIDRRQTPPEKAVLFVGSSSFRGWRGLRADFPHVNIINRAFGSSHLEDIIYYAAQTITPYQAPTIVVYAGDNDIAAGKTVERVFADFQTLVKLIHKNTPKTRIIFVSIKPSPSRREFWNKFQQMNSLVKSETSKDKRLIFADVWNLMLSENGEPREELYLGDRLHLKPAGYAIWREVLQKYLK